MTQAAIEVHGFGKDFGSVRALDTLDLEVRSVEFFGFLGPNGAGKTTTVHMLATLLVAWAVAGLAAATPLLSREGGYTRLAFRGGQG